MSGTGTYLYAICRPVNQEELDGLTGLGGAPVRVLADGAVAGLVSTVPLSEFGEQELRANLEDIAWLERTARQHDDVVRHSAQRRTTIPLRLATICHDDSSARARLARLQDQALELLGRLDDRDEWGVKLYAASSPPASSSAAAPSTASSSSPSGPGSSGTAYLQRRRTELADRDRSTEQARADADAVHTRLAGLAVDARRHRPQDPRLSGASGPMVLNAAYLLDRSAAEQFRRAVTELAEVRGQDAVVLTGPWPPYSFAELDDA
jgi:hypothetical protein